MYHTRSAVTRGALGLVCAFVVALGVGAGRHVEAGPYVPPVGAPPVATPLPPAPPAVGSPFAPPLLVPESVCAPVCTLWEISVGHLGPGSWIADDPVVIQDTPFPDRLHFRIPLNSVPPLGAVPPWNLYIVFDANPWGFAGPFAFRMNSLTPFFTTPAVPEPFPIGTWAYMLVLTDASNVVIDALDPVLVTGTTLAPTVPGTPVAEPASLILLGSGLIALASRRKRTCARDRRPSA